MNFMDLEEKKQLKKKLEQKAELFKAISHPVRLCILEMLLRNNKIKVTDMQCCIEVSQSTVSQHIAKLKAAGIVKGEREGVEIYYSISNEEIKKIIKLILEN